MKDALEALVDTPSVSTYIHVNSKAESLQQVRHRDSDSLRQMVHAHLLAVLCTTRRTFEGEPRDTALIQAL